MKAELVQGLAEKLWISLPKVGGGFFTASSADRADTTQGGNFDRVLEAVSIGAQAVKSLGGRAGPAPGKSRNRKLSG